MSGAWRCLLLRGLGGVPGRGAGRCAGVVGSCSLLSSLKARSRFQLGLAAGLRFLPSGFYSISASARKSPTREGTPTAPVPPVAPGFVVGVGGCTAPGFVTSAHGELQKVVLGLMQKGPFRNQCFRRVQNQGGFRREVLVTDS